MRKIKDIVKSQKIIYKLYYLLGSALLRIVGFFIRTNSKQILFVVYGGQRYDDSPRFIYEYMASSSQYKDYDYVWAFINPQDKTLGISTKNTKTKIIKIDTIQYYIEALRSKYWITNSSVSRGLNFMKKNTINIYTQHGMAGIKVIGDDIKKDNKSFRNAFRENFDLIVIEGKREAEILAKALRVSKDKLLNIGLPRNDELVNRTEKRINDLKKKLKIPMNKKVILYAPTFREYNRDPSLATYLKPPINFDYWYKELGDEYILLFTAHYEVAKLLDVPKNHPFIINKFKYQHINDLMLVSDILISDYSSIIFDYSILEKPIISFAYDFEKYSKERGLYEGYEGIFSSGIMNDEKEVVKFIKNINYQKECEYTKTHIKEKYINCPGNASELFVKTIFGEGNK